MEGVVHSDKPKEMYHKAHDFKAILDFLFSDPQNQYICATLN